MLKSVADFLPERYDNKSEILILGVSPSTKTKAFKNGTFDRLDMWCDFIRLESFDFHNVIPDKCNSMKMADVDEKKLIKIVKGKKKIVALGAFVSKVCDKYNIPHYKIDHPSPRNRNLNDMKYEYQILLKFRDYINA